MLRLKKNDILKKGLKFKSAAVPLNEQKNKYDIITNADLGRITVINEFVQTQIKTPKDLYKYANGQDKNGNTALHYAW